MYFVTLGTKAIKSKQKMIQLLLYQIFVMLPKVTSECYGLNPHKIYIYYILYHL